jgi:hypothetical protein
LPSFAESKPSRLDHEGIGLGYNFGYIREILNEIKFNEA